MVRPRIQYLSDSEKEYVHEQTMRVLEEVGVAYNTPLAIDLLAQAGAPVDRERLTAKIPRELVEECLKTAPDSVLLAARDAGTTASCASAERRCSRPTARPTTCFDDLTGERHEGTAEDLRAAMRLFDALPEVDYVWPSVYPRDCDTRRRASRSSSISLMRL